MTDPHRLIVEGMEQGAALVSTDGVVLFANPRLAELIGREPDAFAGSPMAEVVVAEDQPALAELLAVQPGRHRRAAIVLATPDGPVHTVFLVSHPGGADDPVLCLVTDARTQRVIEANLGLLGELPARILEALPVGVYVIDPAGMSVYVNPEALRLSGLPAMPATADETVGALNLVEAGTRNPYPIERMPGTKALAGEAVHASDVEIRDEPDQVVPVEFWGTPIFRDDDTVEFAVTTVADITERVRAERVVRAQAQMLELAHDAVIVWNPNGRIKYWSGGAETIYGYSTDQAVGKDVHDLLRTRWPRPMAELLGIVKRDGRWEGELLQQRADGSQVFVDSRWAPYVDMHGSLLGTMEINRDATARKEAEAALAQRAAELEVANRDISRSNADLEQFAFAASHDLAEPLRAIVLPLARLAERYEGKLDPEADDYINFAVDGGTRMQKMIEDLLRWSRVGRIEEALAPVDCTAVVDDVRVQLAQTIADTDATIVVGELPTVWAERSQLTQLFQNLLSNALKFVGPGVSPRVEIAAERYGPEWRISVIDNGIGIDPRQRERIFGMFKRLHARDDYPGTGIGLAMVKKVVERHGGSVGVDDAPSGSGSRFWFTIPAAPSPGD